MKEKFITKLPREIEKEEENSICPCCGYEGEENGICISNGGVSEYIKRCKTYIVYSCHRCGCEWQIEE